MNISEMFVASTPVLRKRLRKLERQLEMSPLTKHDAIVTEIVTIRAFLDSKTKIKQHG
jgi:hypothetical protein